MEGISGIPETQQRLKLGAHELFLFNVVRKEKSRNLEKITGSSLEIVPV